MILCVCLNPAVDVTYHVAEVRLGAAHVVERVTRRAGGKGTNVARTLQRLGEPVALLAPLGGPVAAEFTADLAAAAVDLRAVPVDGSTRTTVGLADGTVFNERGAVLDDAAWARVLSAYRAALPRGGLVVLAGSLPPGAARYAPLVELARHASAAVVVDSSATGLRDALTARPDVVKPNVHEAAAVLRTGGRALDPLAAAAGLRRLGARAAVVTSGADGMVADTPDGRWQAVAPAVPGNPTGAGDALTAAVVAGLRHGHDWPRILADGAALAAAAVAAEVAGDYDAEVRERVRARVSVQPLQPDDGRG